LKKYGSGRVMAGILIFNHNDHHLPGGRLFYATSNTSKTLTPDWGVVFFFED
jgi:hypothetical protein